MEALRGQHFWSDLSYPYRELAGAMLLKHWPDDDALLPGALARADGEFNSHWEIELAFRYVLNASTDRADVRRFVRKELGERFPFNVTHGWRVWSRVGAFALVDPAIREAAREHWADPQHRLIGMHKFADYVDVAKDDELIGILLEVLQGEKGTDRYWALDAILRGWGADHPIIRPAIEELAEMPNERLVDIVAHLPRIVKDKTSARELILSVAKSTNARRDMIALGLERLGCGHNDEEAVEAILGNQNTTAEIFDPAPVLYRSFARHPAVRSMAVCSIRAPEAPLASIAKSYMDDPEIAEALLQAAAPLPTDFRSQIVEFAAAGSVGTVLETVLIDAMQETDPDLRVRMMTLHLRGLTDPEAIESAKDTLLAEAHAVGIHHDARRSAALAGLIALGDVSGLVGMQGHNGPLKLQVGGSMDSMPSLERLICENFQLLTEAFGEDLWNRFEHSGRKNRLAEVLATAPSASPEARAAFLQLAENGEMPLTIRALRSLATERPRSRLLLERCRQALEQGSSTNDQAVICAEIGLLLEAEFQDDPEVRANLEENFKRWPCTETAVALAVFAPDSKVLPLPSSPDSLKHFGDFITAMHSIGSRGDTTKFLTFLDAMVTRAVHSQFDGQHIANIAVTRRIQIDDDLQELLSKRLSTKVHPSIAASNARQLAVAGKLGPEGRDHVAGKLTRLAKRRGVPVAGYDAVGMRWRTVRATLLDALRSEVD